MSLNKYMLTKTIPKNGPFLRIKNLGDVEGGTTSPVVTFTGGDTELYDDSSNYRLLYKKRDMDEWKTLPSGIGIQIPGEGNYVDIKKVSTTSYNINAGHSTYGCFHIRLGGFWSEVLGNIANITTSNSTLGCAGMFSGNAYLKHASGLIMGNYGTGTSGSLSLFQGCYNLLTPAQHNSTGTTLNDYAYAQAYHGCKALTAAPDFHRTGGYGTGCFYYTFYDCDALVSAGPLVVNDYKANAHHTFQAMYSNCSNLQDLHQVQLNSASGGYCCWQMFASCTKIQQLDNETSGLALPATDLASGCYQEMFDGCISATVSKHATYLPATNVPDYAYAYMFRGCTAMNVVPIFNITSVGAASMREMFAGCTSLRTIYDGGPQVNYAPCTMISGVEFPSQASFYGMFSGCTSLTRALPMPDNSTHTLTAAAILCFAYMYKGCSSLSTAPDINYINNQPNCYRGMFMNCTALTATPELQIVEVANLAASGFCEMFYNCTSLTQVTTYQEHWNDSIDANKNWLFGVPQQGTFYCRESLTKTYDFSHIPYDTNHKWNVEYIQDTPFVRYQDFTDEMQTSWSNSSGWNANNELLGLGFYRNTSMGSSNIIYTITKNGYDAVLTAAYPWAPSSKYQIWLDWYDPNIPSSNSIADKKYNSTLYFPAITADNNVHAFLVPSSLPNGIYPGNGWQYCDGFTNPYMLPVQYYDNPNATAVETPCGFFFVVLETTPSWVDQNILLIGASGSNCMVIIDDIPQIESFLMIKKIKKSNCLDETDWCDTTGWKKLAISLSSTLWLALKNGNCNLHMADTDNDGTRDAVIDPMLDHPYRISISGSNNNGVVSGNIMSLGSMFFSTMSGENRYSISFWGQNCLKQLFSGCTELKTVSPNLFKNVNFWNCPSGCYEMFAGCTHLTSSPKITTQYGAYDPYIFARMFKDCGSLKLMGAIDVYGYGTTYFKQYACWEMFKGCGALTAAKFSLGFDTGNVGATDAWAGIGVTENSIYLKDTAPTSEVRTYTGDHAFDSMFEGCESLTNTFSASIGCASKYSCANMFKGCDHLVSHQGKISAVLNQGNLSLGVFSGMFSGCIDLLTFDFKAPTSGISCLNTDSYQFSNMFAYCTSLTGVSNFNLVSAAPYCCYKMFDQCAHIILGPTISGVQSYTGSFQSMFENCYRLTGINLCINATAESCCEKMFYGAESFQNLGNSISITNRTETACYKEMFNGANILIPPTILDTDKPTSAAPSCCYKMFRYNQYLTDFPLLIFAASSVIGEYAYCGMFGECYSLTLGLDMIYNGLLYDVSNYEFVNEIPRLNTIGKNYCQSGMFWGCNKLRVTPILENLGNITLETSRGVAQQIGQHDSMFYGDLKLQNLVILQDNYNDCRRLTVDKEHLMFADIVYQNVPQRMVKATLYTNMPPSIKYVGSSSFQPISTYLDALSADKYDILPNIGEQGLRYVNINSEWDIGTEPSQIPFSITNLGETVYVSFGTTDGTLSATKPLDTVYYEVSAYTGGTFPLSKGLVLRLSGTHGYGGMSFAGAANPQIKLGGNIRSVSGSLSDTSYINLLRYFTNYAWLVDAGSLFIGDNAYCAGMFSGCTNLVKPPILGTLNQAGSMNCMFAGCTALTATPPMTLNYSSSNNSAADICSKMFSGCTSLQTANNMILNLQQTQIYAGMFMGCTSLRTGPWISLTNTWNGNLGGACSAMFSGCTSLTGWSGGQNYFPVVSKIRASAFNRMFENCTSLLSATIEYTGTLALIDGETNVSGALFDSTFKGCSSFNAIQVRFTKWDSGTTNWLSGVSANGKFLKVSALPIERSVHKIPDGWTVLIMP